jgi:hypothetical protein
MATPYFRQLPNFDYVTRSSSVENISKYTETKNLFRRAKLRPDIADNILFFTKYTIIGDERPDNIAFKFYDDETLDWVILLSNNILNVQSEWPLTQRSFENVMLEKYGNYEVFYNGIHHYETKEVTNSSGKTLIKSGLRISNEWQTGGGFIRKENDNGDVTYSYEYYEPQISSTVEVSFNDLVNPITNYEYEERIENEKRNIFVLKPQYLNIIFNDLDEIMTYKKGSEQYVSQTLQRGDNIRLYN